MSLEGFGDMLKFNSFGQVAASRIITQTCEEKSMLAGGGIVLVSKEPGSNIAGFETDYRNKFNAALQ